jgi:hypothetical protein
MNETTPASALALGAAAGLSLNSVLGFPETWTPMLQMATVEVEVPPSSPEFLWAADLLRTTIASYHKNASWIHPVVFTSLELVRMVRIQNPALWLRYKARREHLLETAKSKAFPPVTKVLTDSSSGPTTEPAANEFFLFHGLNSSHVPGICKFGFDPRFCSLNGMFGGGVYFAENSSKCNQYNHVGACAVSGYKDTTAGAKCKCKKQDLVQMLLPRVLLGHPLVEGLYRGNSPGDYWHGRRQEPEKPGGGFYNSVLGESKTNFGPKATLQLREYVIYESSQVYPEYLLFYRRV